jgi:hypothetical protein
VARSTNVLCHDESAFGRVVEGGAMIAARRVPAAGALLAASLLSVACTGTKSDPAMRIDVRGVVVFDGVPVPGVTVAIPGVGATTTAIDGTFAFAGVRAPYDVGVGLASLGHATFYQAVRSATPRLPILVAPGPRSTGIVSGTLSGGEGYPQPTNHDTRVCLDFDGSFGANGGTPVPPGTFSASVSWWGTAAIDATLRGIQVVADPASGLPTDYVAYGQIDALTLTTAGVSDQVLTLDAISATTLSGTVTVPDGYALSSAGLDLGCLRLAQDPAPTASFSYRTPDVPGSALTLAVEAVGTSGTVTTRHTGLAPSATGISVTTPAAPQIWDPAEWTSLVGVGTVFSWSELAGATYALMLLDDGWPFLTIVTPHASTALPDPSIVGVPLPSGSSLTWAIFSVSPRTIAEIVADGRIPPPGDMSETSSWFTGAPTEPPAPPAGAAALRIASRPP